MTNKLKHIKTKLITGILTQAASVVGGEVIAYHMWQDDITIIGGEIFVSAEIPDASINADGFLSGFADLSRVGIPLQDSSLLFANIVARWSGIFSVNSPLCKDMIIMFPNGYGVDMDNGETIYLNGGNMNNTVAILTCYYRALIYYVER